MEKASFLGSLLILFSCGLIQTHEADKENLKSLSDFVEDIQITSKEVDYGPTIKDSTYFKDVTEDYGLNGLEAVTFNIIDFNNDGFSDIVYLPYYYSKPKILIFNSKLKKFVPIDDDPFPEDFKASFLVFHDFNKDGVIDLISGVFNQKSEVSKVPLRFFQGNVLSKKIRFEFKSDILNLNPLPTSSIALIDYNLDGFMDLFVGNWFQNINSELVPTGDKLLELTKDFKFKDVSFLLMGENEKQEGHLYPPNAMPTFGASTCDIDLNGFPDIMTVSSSGYKNKLWVNVKVKQDNQRMFQDIGVQSNYAADQQGILLRRGGGRSFFSSCTDYNNDGLMDIFLGELIHGYDNESVDKSSILTGTTLNFPPYFIRTEYVSDGTREYWNQGDRRANWIDYNLDGRVDLLVDNSGFPPYSRLVLFEQNESHLFENKAAVLGLDVVNPSATVMMDFNKDGRPDILTSQTNIRKAEIKSRLYLFENKTDPMGRSLKIHLSGVKSNREGIGAMIELTTQSKKDHKLLSQKRYVEYFQGGLASQNEEGVIFGYPKNHLIKNISVVWPIISRNKSNEALKVDYKIKKNKILELTLCENGSFFYEKKSCN